MADPTTDADLLRAFLAGRDVACPNCDYNLRDLTGDCCPECGQELALRLRLAEPRLAAFLAGLVGLSAGAGFSALLFLYFLLMSLRFGLTARGAWGFITITLAGTAVLGAAVILWLRSRRRLRNLSPQARWALAAGCWALSLADLAAFTYTIR